MVFDVLTDMGTGTLILYVAVLAFCLFLNNKIMKDSAYLVSGAFSIMQLLITVWIAAAGDDTSMLLMAFIFVVAIMKTNVDMKGRSGF